MNRTLTTCAIAAMATVPTAFANNFIDCDPYDGFALQFNGVDAVMQVGPDPVLEMTTAMTFEAWIYPTGAGSSATFGGIIVNREGEYEIGRNPNGTIAWAIAPSWTWRNTGAVAPLNEWTHVALSFDQGVVNTYVNGQLVHTLTQPSPITDVSAMDDFRIGARQGGDQFFAGRIEEARMWNIARTQSELLSTIKESLSGSENGLVGYWPMDEGSSVIAADMSGSANPGLLLDTTWQATATCVHCGPFDGSAIDFDGVNDRVEIPASPDFDMFDEFTLEAWIFPTGDQVGRGVIAGQEGEYMLAYDVDRRLYWAVSGANPTWTWIDSEYIVDAQQWTHVAMVYLDGLTRVYANGNLVHTTAGLGPINDAVPEVNGLWIGARDRADGNPIQFFDGRIDEVRVWTRARTQSSIQATMSTGLSGMEPDLVGYWRFNEGSGATVGDLTGAHPGAFAASFWHTTSDCDPGTGNCLADITGPGGASDGNVDSLDFLMLIAQWGSPCGGDCAADISGPSDGPDGNVDSLDFLLLIAQWGTPGSC